MSRDVQTRASVLLGGPSIEKRSRCRDAIRGAVQLLNEREAEGAAALRARVKARIL